MHQKLIGDTGQARHHFVVVDCDGLFAQVGTRHHQGVHAGIGEKQVLQLIAQGRSNKEIAALLDLSVNTVSVHRANLMEKMNIHRTAELVLFAIRKGLVVPQ